MIFTDPAAARKLLMFRYRGLAGAIERAAQVDCRGARYPFCTIDGPESCATWQHADMEIHVGEGICRAIELYVMHTGDTEFLWDCGAEMLLQICRYYASRGGWSPTKKDFGFYGVMGPDEYHTVVNHSCYTNWMGRKCFEYTLGVLEEMRREAPDKLAAAKEKVQLDDGEPAEWGRMAEAMRIPRDDATGVYEQHAGYFDLPEVDVQAIGPDEIPIYTHWAYERILRTAMVKQADVLLLPVWFAHEWTLKDKKANFDFYEPRTIHESSFSPGIHQILAAELGYEEMALEYFRYMARLDLDDYHRNTAQGLHMTPKSGTWMCVTHGFAGMRTDLPVPAFAPTLPAGWRGYRFRVVHRGSVLEVKVTGAGATLRVVNGPALPIRLYGEEATATREGLTAPLRPPGEALSAPEA
jgi:maltose phosphorylase